MKAKIYDIGGLDYRSKDITRSDTNCTDCNNVILNRVGSLVSRPRLKAIDKTSLGSILPYRARNEVYSANPFKRIDIPGQQAINRAGGFITSLPLSTKTNYTEVNNVLYINNESGLQSLVKFDGYMLYKAGMDTINASYTVAETSNGKVVRFAPYLIDLQGNEIYGEYTDLPGDTAITTSSFNIDWGGANASLHYDRYGICTSTTTLNSGSLILPATNNYIAGDYLRMKDTSGEYRVVKVTSATATDITLEIPTGISFTVQTSAAVEDRVFVRLFVSLDGGATFNTNLVSPLYNYNVMLLGAGLTGILNSINLTPLFTPDLMEKVYDSSIVRGLPPKCKYISSHQKVLVLGNRRENNVNTAQQSRIFHNSIYWSSVNLLAGGTSVENFDPLDTEEIGEQGDGEISGLASMSSSLLVGKERQIYYMNGLLISGNYRIISYNLESIGIASHKSMINAFGGIVAMTTKGIYFFNESSYPKEISDTLEPLFTDGTWDLTQTELGLDNINERLYISILRSGSVKDNKLVIYDYYHKQWFKYDNFPVSDGLATDNDGNLYVSGVTDITANTYLTGLYSLTNSIVKDLVFVGTNVVASSKVFNSQYSSNWFHAGEPSLKKKFTLLTIIDPSQSEYVANVKTQNNWDFNKDLTNFSIDLGAGKQIRDLKLSANKAFSTRFIVDSDDLISIEGFELDIYLDSVEGKGSI